MFSIAEENFCSPNYYYKVTVSKVTSDTIEQLPNEIVDFLNSVYLEAHSLHQQIAANLDKQL